MEATCNHCGSNIISTPENPDRASATVSQFCRDCGYQLPANAQICTNCGAPTKLYFAAQLVQEGETDIRAMRWYIPVNRPFTAIAAGYLGLLAVLPLFDVAAIICGIWGRTILRENPQMEGWGRCLFGIISGIFCLVLHLCWFMYAVFFSK